MSSKSAIEVSCLSKCYKIYDSPRDRLKEIVSLGNKKFSRDFWALRDASFSIARGETVGVIGRNGSGKSTLLQMICGTVSPTSGSVSTRGRIAGLLELGAGFNPEFTGRENVLLNAAILGFPQGAMKERMATVLEFSELGEFLDQPVKTYSSGMYARLAFSVAIHVDPEILVVDEALAVGDSRFVAKCMRRIKDIQKKGATILFVSHDVGSVRTLCDRAIWIDAGKVVDDGDVFPVTGRYNQFLFQDELSENQAELVNTSTELREGEKTLALEAVARIDSSNSLDPRPVTHWGSRKGIIIGASICDIKGQQTDAIAYGEQIEVRITVDIPSEISRENLSIAFSIKDLKGSDLIVSATDDNGKQPLPDVNKFTVTFCFKNQLVSGKYLLVAAVENRRYRDIHYYEYLEGAHYFSSLADVNYFGIFQPEIRQSVWM